MRMLIATGIFSPEVGGPAVYVPPLALELQRLGHQIMVVTYSDQAKYDSDSCVPYPVIRIKRKNFFSNYFKYFLALKRESGNYDIIYAFDYFSAGLPALLAAKIFGKKLVIRNGGDLIWERFLSNQKREVTMRDFYQEKLYKKSIYKYLIAVMVFHFADLLIFSTKFQRDLFEKYYRLDPSKIKLIDNPIPDGGESIIRHDHPIKRIVWAGRMEAKNNVERLVRVFCDFDQSEFELVLIGEGQLKKRVEKFLQNRNHHVSLLEKMPREELRGYIASSYAAIYPAYTDISPNSVFDCLQADVPFLLTKEHGYDWLRGKVLEFDPMSDEEMRASLLKIFNEDYYRQYKNDINKIKYTYSFQQLAVDTAELFSQVIACSSS
jgi:glycosyltransferase involved in cell wall biosynthesis